MPPNAATAPSTAAWTSSAFETSPGSAMASPPPARIVEAVSSNGAGRRPVTATLAPSAANSLAIAAPSPVPPPVMMAAFPLRRPLGGVTCVSGASR